MKNNINIILGNHGSGKTEYIYNYFLNNCMNSDGFVDLQKKFYLVVPEQDTHEKQKLFLELAKKQHHGIINIDVVSFDRLCHIVFDELNISIEKENVADEDIKRILLKKVLLDIDDNKFIYFKNMKNKVGFTDKLKSAISEFYSYNIDNNTIDEVLPKISNDKLKMKLRELAIVYEEFKKLLEKYNFKIKEDKLNLLNQYLPMSHICDNAVFAFDGFTGFTPIQKSIYTTICDKALETFVSIDIRDVNSDAIIKSFTKEGDINLLYKNELNRKKEDVFYLSYVFIKQVIEVAVSQNKIFEEKNIIDLCKNNNKLYKAKLDKYDENHKDLYYLEQNIFRTRVKGIKPFDGKIKNISIHKCSDKETEVDYLIREIYTLQKEHNYNLNDIKVVVPLVEDYSDILIQKCTKNNIEVYIDNKKPIYNSPIIECIRSILDVMLYNFSIDSVMRYLNCGLFEKDKTFYLFDNAIRKYGLKGYNRYQSFLENKKEKIENKKQEENEKSKDKQIKNYDIVDENLQFIIGLKDTILNPLFDLYKKITKSKKHTMIEYIKFVEGFIKDANIYEKFEDILEFLKKDDVESIDYKILKHSKEIIDKTLSDIKRIYVDDVEKVDLKDFKEIFEVAIEGKGVRITPFAMEELDCGDLMRSRFDNPKVVFFMGLNESKIPQRKLDNNIIDDYMRDTLEKNCSIVLSQTTKETTLNQRFYTYLTLTNPTDKLYLSFTEKDSEGKVDYESSIIQNIRTIFNDEISYINEKPQKKDYNIQDIETIVRINSNLLNDVCPINESTSVSKLEDYARCPYKYFLDNVIHLNERKSFVIDNRDVGEFYHKIMEELFKKQDFNIEKSSNDDIKKSIDGIVKDIRESNDKYNGSNYSDFVVEKLSEVILYSVEKMKEKIGNFVPIHVASEERMYHNIEGLDKKLVGRIDSIDIYKDDENNYARVVDYKSSNKCHDEEEMKKGISIQHIVYLDYVMQHLKDICKNKNIECSEETKALGSFYFQIKDDMDVKDLNKEESDDNGDFAYKGIYDNDVAKEVFNNDEGYIKNLLSKDKKYTIVEINNNIKIVNEKIIANSKNIRDGIFDISPYHPSSKSCDFCNYKTICKKDLKKKIELDEDENVE